MRPRRRESEMELRVDRGIGRIGEPPHLDRPFVPARRAVVVVKPSGVQACAARQLRGALRIEERRRFAGVMGALGDAVVRARARVLERLGDARLEGAQRVPGRCRFGQQRIANQRVREAEAICAVQGEEARSLRLAHAALQIDVAVERLLQHRALALEPDRRGAAEHGARRLGETLRAAGRGAGGCPPAGALPTRRRPSASAGDRASRASAPPRRGRGDCRPSCAPALRPARAASRHRFATSRSPRSPARTGPRAASARARSDAAAAPARASAPVRRSHRARDRSRSPRWGGPRARARRTRAARATRSPTREGRRGRARGGGGPRNARGTCGRPRRAGTARRRCRASAPEAGVRGDPGCIGEETRRRLRRTAQESGPAAAGRVGQEPHDPRPRPQGRRDPGVDAPGGGDVCAGGARARDEQLGRPRLPDARLASQEQDAAAARQRGVDARGEARAQLFAADVRAARVVFAVSAAPSPRRSRGPGLRSGSRGARRSGSRSARRRDRRSRAGRDSPCGLSELSVTTASRQTRSSSSSLDTTRSRAWTR